MPQLLYPRPLLAVCCGLLLAFLCLPARAQAPVGHWQLHMPGTSATTAVAAGDAVYAAGYSDRFAFYRYSRTDQSVRILSKEDGFSDIGVDALAFDSLTQQVVVGYRTTNLDLLNVRTGTITNLNDIQRKTIAGDKRINSINAAGRRAYLACTFGIVVLDLEAQEIADTYANLGPGGQVLNVFGTAVLHDSLFAATDKGVLVGRLSDNLLDYANWQLYAGTQQVRAVAAFDDHLYVAWNFRGLVQHSASGWTTLPGIALDYKPTSLTATGGVLTLGHDQGATVIRPGQASFEVTNGSMGRIYQAARGRDGRYYMADPDRGLFVVDAAGATLVVPNGPVDNVSFSTAPAGADTYAFLGGYSPGTAGVGLPLGFSRLHNGRWENYNRFLLPDTNQYPGAYDRYLSAGAWNPTNNKLYIASYGNGLLEWAGPGQFRHFDARNSPLLPATGVNAPDYTRATSVAVDAQGIVWVVNFHQRPGEPGLFSFDPRTSQWKAHLAGVPNAEWLEHIVIDDNGYKWLTVFPKDGRGGIIVYDDRNNRSRYLSSAASSGGILGASAYVAALAKDRKGDMWIGTSNGIQVFYNTGSVFPTSQAYTAAQPIIDRRPLLDGQQVRAIAVDGGNRKWVGTDEGLWLFGPDGDVALANFTAANSPLPTDHVLSLSVNGVTGEVFIGTERGLASFRGTATEPPADGKPSCTVVFPNPVPARFSGQIAIDGLTGGAVVKITDVAGQLVYETTANGGRAVWNAKDYNGHRVRTGIYLAYSADADGKNTCVSKIAVMGE